MSQYDIIAHILKVHIPNLAINKEHNGTVLNTTCSTTVVLRIWKGNINITSYSDICTCKIRIRDITFTNIKSNLVHDKSKSISIIDTRISNVDLGVLGGSL